MKTLKVTETLYTDDKCTVHPANDCSAYKCTSLTTSGKHRAQTCEKKGCTYVYNIKNTDLASYDCSLDVAFTGDGCHAEQKSKYSRQVDPTLMGKTMYVNYVFDCDAKIRGQTDGKTGATGNTNVTGKKSSATAAVSALASIVATFIAFF
jgi:hypothetical protein